MKKTLEKTRKKLVDYIIENVEGIKVSTVYDDLIFLLELRDDNNKTMIENFIIKEKDRLSFEEVDILLSMQYAHVSIFSIIKEGKNTLEFQDQFTKEVFKIEKHKSLRLDPNVKYLCKIAKTKEYSFLVGLPMEISKDKYHYIKNYILDQYNSLKDKSDLKSFLKYHSLETIMLSKEDPFEELLEEFFDDPFEELFEELFDDLNDFSAYMEDSIDPDSLDAYNFALAEVYDLALKARGLGLTDIDQLDILGFLMESIEQNIIISQEELNNFIDGLKAYLDFLARDNTKYHKKLAEIIEISRKRFKLMEKLKPYSPLLDLDPDLIEVIKYLPEEQIIPIVKDMDSFLLYTSTKKIELTKTNRLKRVDLNYLANIMTSSREAPMENKNQDSYKLIDFIFEFTIKLGIHEFIDGNLVPTTLAINFIRKLAIDKYALLLSFFAEDKEDLNLKLEGLIQGLGTKEFMEINTERTYRLLMAFQLIYVNILDDKIYLTETGREILNYLQRPKINTNNVIKFPRI